MSEEIGEAMNRLRKFMFENVYSQKSAAKKEEAKAEDTIKRLFEYYYSHTDMLPKDLIALESDKEQLVCDYIAGMTDRYAIEEYIALFVPAQWGGK